MSMVELKLEGGVMLILNSSTNNISNNNNYKYNTYSYGLSCTSN